jgi:hypothetical protein
MKETLQKIFLAAAAILFLCCAAAFVFLYHNINSNNEKAQTDIRAWRAELDRRNDIRSLDRSLEGMKGDTARLQTHFAESSDVVPFLDTIEKLAPKAGAKAEVGSVIAGADNAALIVTLKASGSFESVYKFLTLLENSPYELDFISMDFHAILPDASQKGGRALGWEAVFKIQLLSFIP